MSELTLEALQTELAPLRTALARVQARVDGIPVPASADSGDRERSIRSFVNTESGDHEHLLAWA